jgi:hypothetical protein
MTYILGDHSLKFGFDIQTIRSRATELSDATGTFNFANFGTFQQNVLSRFRLNFGTGSDVKNTYYSVFANDEFKLRQNLTVSFGLRYEREASVQDADNFGPRLGVAWSPFKNNKGVVRFGAGIFYNRTLLRTIADFIQNVNGIVSFDTNAISTIGDINRRSGILAAIAQRFPNSFATEAELRALVANACATIVTNFPCSSRTGFIVTSGDGGNPLRSVDPSLQIPESYQFNVGFRARAFKGWVFEANYTWNRTIKLWRDRNINAPRLPAGYEDWADYLDSNVFQLSPTRRYTFYRGSTTDTIGLGTAQVQSGNSSGCTTTTANCFVNLNTLNNSTTTPLVAVAGQNNNATGAPLGIALAAIARFRPDPNFEEQSRIGSVGARLLSGLDTRISLALPQMGFGFRRELPHELHFVLDQGRRAEQYGERADQRRFQRRIHTHRAGPPPPVQFFGHVRHAALARKITLLAAPARGQRRAVQHRHRRQRPQSRRSRHRPPEFRRRCFRHRLSRTGLALSAGALRSFLAADHRLARRQFAAQRRHGSRVLHVRSERIKGISLYRKNAPATRN